MDGEEFVGFVEGAGYGGVDLGERGVGGVGAVAAGRGVVRVGRFWEEGLWDQVKELGEGRGEKERAGLPHPLWVVCYEFAWGQNFFRRELSAFRGGEGILHFVVGV